ncbi:MAG: hypothetical protein HRT90_02250 [Candidatus Margulisbacteria bacterium]|nr:hypothetical protein [Candidatus Margulisiibacteriota bacterium]
MFTRISQIIHSNSRKSRNRNKLLSKFTGKVRSALNPKPSPRATSNSESVSYAFKKTIKEIPALEKLHIEEYTGDLKDGLPHGEGIAKYNKEYNNGGTYTGEFKDGKRHGHGTYAIDCNKHLGTTQTYSGEWKNGQRDGYGKAKSKNSTYYGQWVSGRRKGYGKHSRKNGSQVFRGLFLDNEARSGNQLTSKSERFGEFYKRYSIRHQKHLRGFLIGVTLIGSQPTHVNNYSDKRNIITTAIDAEGCHQASYEHINKAKEESIKTNKLAERILKESHDYKRHFSSIPSSPTSIDHKSNSNRYENKSDA